MKKVARIGVGTIGSSWATLFAWRGCEVRIYDVNEDVLNKALERIQAIDLLNEIFENNKDIDDILSKLPQLKIFKAAVEDSEYIQELLLRATK